MPLFYPLLVPFVRDSQDKYQNAQTRSVLQAFGIYVYRSSFLQTYASLTSTLLEQAEKA